MCAVTHLFYVCSCSYIGLDIADIMLGKVQAHVRGSKRYELCKFRVLHFDAAVVLLLQLWSH
jgi:hypothetical protein